MLKEITIDEEARTLTLILELIEPSRSASGKTFVIATTDGNVPTDVRFDGKPVIVGVNAYIRAR